MDISILDDIALIDIILQEMFGIDSQVIFYKVQLDLLHLYLKFLINYMSIYIISQN